MPGELLSAEEKLTSVMSGCDDVMSILMPGAVVAGPNTPKHNLRDAVTVDNEVSPAFKGLHNLSDRHIPWSRSRTGMVGQISEPSLLICY